MKKLILLLLLLQGSIVFGQIKFENKKIALVNDIYFKTTKDNIDSFMKEKGFEKEDVEQLNDGEIKEVYIFSSQIESIEVYYTKANKIQGVSCIYDGVPNAIFIEMELKNKGYTAKIVKQDFGGETISKNVWSKTGSKLKFITSSDEKEKMGVVAFGNYEEE
ncbi:hypothetical protein [Flavobacterium fluvii]|nr:hypothetical protein [Flavobacterium fluvii]